MSIHGDVKETVRVGVGTPGAVSPSDEVHHGDLGNIQNLADIPNQGLRSETWAATVVCGI